MRVKRTWRPRHLFVNKKPILAGHIDGGLTEEQKNLYEDFDLYFSTDGLNNLHKLSKLSTINFFVGANNSGKSRLIRAILKYLSNEVQDFKKGTNQYQNHFKQEMEKLRAASLKMQNQPGQPEWFRQDNTKNVNLHEMVSNLNLMGDKDNPFQNVTSNLSDDKNFLSEKLETVHNLIECKFTDTNEESLEEYNLIQHFNSILSGTLSLMQAAQLKDSKFIYVPTLRGITYLHPGNDEKGIRSFSLNNIYENTVFQNYFRILGNYVFRANPQSDEKNKNVYISTGFTLYYDIKKMLLGNQRDRDLINKYQQFLSSRVFDGQDVTLIPYHQGNPETDNTLWVKIGNNADREIFNLGDGVQSLILLTFPMFVYDEAIFFIEEPELHMHPGMQRKFVEILKFFASQEDKCHQYYITTHSNHLLDLALDFGEISIYTLSKNEDNKFQIKLASAGDRTTLDLLGVQNSSVFLSNCMIWVEGPSDRIYFKKFLELYIDSQEHLKFLSPILQEGIHYSFVFSGGSNIVHLDFSDELSSLIDEPSSTAKFIFDRSMVIVDGDEGSEKKEKNKVKLRERLGDDFVELKLAVETENLLSYPSILKGIKSYKSWSKISDDLMKEIFPAASDISQEKIYETRLGSLIEDEMLVKIRTDSPSFDSELFKKVPKNLKMSFADESESKESTESEASEQNGAKIKKSPKRNITRTINDKVPFARGVCDSINWDDLNSSNGKTNMEALEVTNKILEFILKHNADLGHMIRQRSMV